MRNIAWLAIGIPYILLTAFLIPRFPAVNSDEVVRAVISQHVIHGEPSRYSLYDNVFEPSVYIMRDVLPETSIKLYHAWLGAWSSLDISSYVIIRLSSLFSGGLALVVFFGLGRQIGGVRTGLWCTALVALSPFFLTASCIARPETLLLLTSTAVLWLNFRLPDRLGMKPFILGLLAMLQMGIHPNAAVICSGLFIFYLLGVPAKQRLAKGSLFVAGAVAGLLSVVLILDLKRLWLGMHTVHSALLRPPIFLEQRRPLEWFSQTLRVIWTGQTYYVNENSLLWRIGVQSWCAAILFLVAITLWQVRRQESVVPPSRWLAALAGVFISTVLLVKAKECLYATNFFPFLIPLAASAMSPQQTSVPKQTKIIAGLLLITSLTFFLCFTHHYTQRVKPYAQVVRELRAMLPAEPLNVAGPSVLWFAWDKTRYRDSGAILLSHWYTKGGRDLKRWIEPWQPDILILDEAMQSILDGPGPTPASIESYLNRPVDFLGVLETGAAYGNWKVYRIHWR